MRKRKRFAIEPDRSPSTVRRFNQYEMSLERMRQLFFDYGEGSRIVQLIMDNEIAMTQADCNRIADISGKDKNLALELFMAIVDGKAKTVKSAYDLLYPGQLKKKPTKRELLAMAQREHDRCVLGEDWIHAQYYSGYMDALNGVLLTQPRSDDEETTE
jgi:hypothetical protein